MTRPLCFLAGWTAACLTVTAGALGLLWVFNAGSGRHPHLHRTDAPRSVR